MNTDLDSSSEESSMVGSSLALGFVASSLTEAVPRPIRVVLDGVWAEGRDLLKNTSLLGYLFVKIRLISRTGLNPRVYLRTVLLCEHEFAPLHYPGWEWTLQCLDGPGAWLNAGMEQVRG